MSAAQAAPPTQPGGAGGAVEGAARRHLHAVDAVRLLTFAAVIAVHATWATNPLASVPAGTALVWLHFTRGTFFVLSAFVLLRGQLARQVPAPTLWRRRFPPVLVPYLVWSLLYWLNWARVVGVPPWHARPLRVLLYFAWSGNAAYHLYFLLVSMQLYLVVPLLVRLVRRTRGAHARLLAAAVAVQAAGMAGHHWGWPHGAGWDAVRGHDFALLPLYTGYVVAGALVADHFDGFDAWVRGRGRAVLLVVLGGAALAQGAYWAQVATGAPAWWAAEALAPWLLAWTLAVSVGLYRVGVGYERRRAAAPGGRLARWVAEGSLISFGVYLVHPLVLSLLGEYLVNQGAWALRAPVSTVVLWLLAVVVSVAFVEGLGRTPLSLALTGRPRRAASAGPPHRATTSP